MNLVVMCQGQQRRLPDLKHPKHLLPVGGEPILERTLRLLQDMEPTLPVDVVGSCIDFMPLTRKYAPNAFMAPLEEAGNCIVDGILAAQASWSPRGRTLVLLGDVVWSRSALADVLFEVRRRPVVFAGTPVLTAAEGEVFALGFDDPQDVENLCRTCPCRMDGSRSRVFSKAQGGHLRRLLWWYQDRDRNRLRPPYGQSWHPDCYLPITDWTMDVDTQADVERLPEIARLIEMEERGRAAG